MLDVRVFEDLEPFNQYNPSIRIKMDVNAYRKIMRILIERYSGLEAPGLMQALELARQEELAEDPYDEYIDEENPSGSKRKRH
jgi:hypothetical protein